MKTIKTFFSVLTQKCIIALTILCFAFIFCGTAASAQTISGGTLHSLTLCFDGTVNAVGFNGEGQLGDGTYTDRNTPVQVSGLTGISAVAGKGRHSLFLKDDGTVWAVGNNSYGQYGDGTNTTSTTPVQVSGLTSIVAVAGGYNHSLFLKDDGTAWAAGRNQHGQLGDETYTHRNIPVQVSGLTGITAVAAGGNHSLFLKDDGTVWAAGRNEERQLGDGTNIENNIPVQVSGITGIIAVASGLNHSLFLKDDGTAWAVGWNAFGQLGDGTESSRSIPVQVSSLTDITAVAGGNGYSLFLKNDGTAWATGSNNKGQLGDGTGGDDYFAKSSPVQVSGLNGITAIAGGGLFSLFLKEDGTTWAAGENNAGQLGDGTNTDKNIPVQMNTCNTQVTSVIEKGFFYGLKAYPNPVQNTLYLNTGETNGEVSIQLYDIAGMLVFQKSATQSKFEIDMENLPSGVYLLKVNDGEKKRIMNVVR